MSEYNNKMKLVRIYNNLKKLQALHLEECNAMIDEYEDELAQMDDEFVTFFFLNNRLRLETLLMSEFSANDFEDQFGFPLELLLTHFARIFGIHEKSDYREERLTCAERIKFFETKFHDLKDDDNKVDSSRSTFRVAGSKIEESSPTSIDYP